MSSPDQYPQLPPGVAPAVVGIASEFAAIRNGVDEAVRQAPPVITFPPVPPPQVIPPSSPPETVAGAAQYLAAPWTEWQGGFQYFRILTIGSHVFLSGLLKCTTAVAAGSVVGTLPAGSRPGLLEMFSCMGTNGSADVSLRVDVNNGGVIVVQSALVANAYLSVANIHFSTL